MGDAFGVKASHVRPMRKVIAMRQQRAAQRQQMEQMQMATAAAEGYSKTTKAPEPGSPFSEEME